MRYLLSENLSRHYFYSPYFLNILGIFKCNQQKQTLVNLRKRQLGLEETGPRQLQKVLVAGTTRLSHQLKEIGFKLFIFFLLKKQSLKRENAVD